MRQLIELGRAARLEGCESPGLPLVPPEEPPDGPYGPPPPKVQERLQNFLAPKSLLEQDAGHDGELESFSELADDDDDEEIPLP